MDQVSRSQGGKTASAKNRRRGDGQFVASPTPKVVDTTAVELNPRDWFRDSQPAPHVRKPRPWPVVSGSKHYLDGAIEHFLGVAERNSIRVQYTDDTSFADIGLYNHGDRSVTLHADLRHTPGLYAFVLAHELAHAFDPILHVTPMPYSGTSFADIESLAELAAIKALTAWGMTLEHQYAFIDWTDQHRVLSAGWRKRLPTTLNDRLYVVATPLMPVHVNEQADTERRSRYNKASRKVERQARRQLKDQRRRNKH